MSIDVLIAPVFPLSAALEAECLSRLPAERRASLAQVDLAARQRSLIGSRLLWQHLQGLGFGHDALSTWQQPPRSRPVLGLPIDFSVSHGGAWVLCAVSTEGAVGVDIEPVSGLVAGEFLHYLDDDERQRAGDDPRRFLAIWTAKEAVVKAAGRLGLRELPGVATAPDGRSAGFDGRAWHLRRLAVDDDHVAHLAHAAGHDTPGLRLTRVPARALEQGLDAAPESPP